MAELLRAAARAAQPWRNGGGVTFEVARRPHPSATREYLWRVSIARVASAGPFSAFHGFQRLIMVIEGNGMSLRGLGAADVALERDQPRRFDGAAAVEGLIPQGPVSDLNVIFDPDHCDARLRVLDGPAPPGLAAGSERLLINLARTPIQWRSGDRVEPLGRLDAVWFSNPLEPCDCGHRTRCVDRDRCGDGATGIRRGRRPCRIHLKRKCALDQLGRAGCRAPRGTSPDEPPVRQGPMSDGLEMPEAPELG